MQLKPMTETFSICQVPDYSQVNFESEFFFLAQTDEEKSLVCLSADVPANAIQADANWSAFRIEGILDFSLVGILSKLSGLLADQGIGLFAVSTYNTDYILTKTKDFKRALAVLKQAGYKVEER
ncbi:ACT domain-containing protein [Streptococcus caviae]|uniref:ACT domain-containing protein n=1 Tax=Streptococcus sp. 'caviae' TaxID=1915004 RepID=UPI00214BA5B3|nr:ACT domain-containing protein [Streptococcus sp. 'caviae']